MKHIGIYAGSFDPFHAGHNNVLAKAKYIFDEVIVAIGINPTKLLKDNADLDIEEEVYRRLFQVKTMIPGELVDYYTTFLVDYVRQRINKDTRVTVIRGLRDEYDLSYETKQIRYMQDMMPEISVIEILCDKEFSHISSSGIRDIAKFEKNLDIKVDYASKYLKF
jgi:pantetheine-phosphate adenylyltransferase